MPRNTARPARDGTDKSSPVREPAFTQGALPLQAVRPSSDKAGVDVREPALSTRARWRSRRWTLILGFVTLAVGDLIRTSARGDWRADAIFWGITATGISLLGGVSLPLRRRRDRLRASREGALFSSSARMVTRPVNAPPAVEAAFSDLRKSIVFGRSALDRDLFAGFVVVRPSSLAWEPGRIARDRGAQAWELDLREIDYFEIGHSAGQWAVDVHFVSGSFLTMEVDNGKALRLALMAAEPESFARTVRATTSETQSEGAVR